jgi:hypothetical protein
VLKELPTDELTGELRNLAGALSQRAMSSVTDRLGATAERLGDYAEGHGGPGLLAALTGAERLAKGESPLKAGLFAGLSGVKGMAKGVFDRFKGSDGRGGGGGGKLKVTNIIESVDVGVPVRIAYDQWTQFREFPKFTKKVENVDQKSEEKLQWRAQIFWSHRDWESTIVEQVPDERIIWTSKGSKGHVDGAVTFHELAPSLTRIIVVLAYYPQGFFEHTGNLWRAQGRRARLELKHFARHVMTETIRHPDELDGWRGEIHDGEVQSEEEEPEANGEEEANGEAEEEEQRPVARRDRRGRSRREDRDDERASSDEGYEGGARRRPRSDSRQLPGRRSEQPRRVSRPTARAAREE